MARDALDDYNHAIPLHAVLWCGRASGESPRDLSREETRVDPDGPAQVHARAERDVLNQTRASQGPASARVLAYAERIQGQYADAYFLRQVHSIDATLVVGSSDDTGVRAAARTLSMGGARVARFDRRLSHRLRRLRLWTSDSVIYPLRLRDAVARTGLVYSFFLWNAPSIVDALRLLPARDRPPFVVHAAGSDVTRLRSRTAAERWRELRVLNAADCVLCGSEFIRECVVGLGVSRKKTRVHYIGIDVDNAVGAAHSAREDVIFLAVSRLVPVKGVAYTLEAFADAFPKGAGARLVVIGDGPLRSDLEASAVALGISGAVSFRGHVSPAEVRSAMAEADVFLQHNIVPRDGSEEALGGSLLEAAAAGLPCVASRTGGVSEAVLDGASGYLVEAENVPAMALAMRDLASDVERRIAMGEAGRDFVRRTHNATLQDATLKCLLDSLARK